MDTSDSEIVFDGNGNCNHCNNFYDNLSNLVYKGDKSNEIVQKLVQKIKKSKGKGKFDCVIGVSGGVDSSYVAYLTKELGLSPLAVHMDNGWDSAESVENIKNICNKLQIKYQSYVLDWMEFKDIQLSVLKSSIPEVEIPTDIAIAGVLHRVAAKHNIKYIIGGGNIATEGILPDSWFYNPKDEKLLKSIQKKFGSVKIKKFPFFDYKREIYYKYVKGIRMVYLLNYVDFSKDEAIKILKKDLDWKQYGGKHHESKYTSFVQSYIQPLKFNLDYRRATLSNQICSGEISREDAIEELKNKPYNIKTINEQKDYICKKLGIDLQTFEDILNSPVKTYKDYPNDENKLEFIYSVYKKFFKKPIVE